MPQMRTIVIIFIAVLITILAMQNIASVEIQFLFWKFSLPLVLVIGITFVLGFIIGYGVNAAVMFYKSGNRDREIGDDEIR